MSKLSVLYTCGTCDTAFSVPLGDPEIHLLESGLPCPQDECEGKLVEAEEAKTKPIRIGASLLYFAINGMGLPEERDCAPDTMKHLLLGQKIDAVEILPAIDNKRCYLLSITIGDKKIHLGSSNKGPTVYKVTNVKHISRSSGQDRTQSGSTSGGEIKE